MCRILSVLGPVFLPLNVSIYLEDLSICMYELICMRVFCTDAFRVLSMRACEPSTLFVEHTHGRDENRNRTRYHIRAEVLDLVPAVVERKNLNRSFGIMS